MNELLQWLAITGLALIVYGAGLLSWEMVKRGARVLGQVFLPPKSEPPPLPPEQDAQPVETKPKTQERTEVSDEPAAATAGPGGQ